MTMNQPNNSSLKSNLSSVSKFNNGRNNSFIKNKKSTLKEESSSPASSPSKETPSGQTRNVKLTTQVLHPEKFLFERRKVT